MTLCYALGMGSCARLFKPDKAVFFCCAGGRKLFVEIDLRSKDDESFDREVDMATEQTHSDDEDEPTEAEIEQQKRRQEQTWKHDDSRELSDRDQERPLKP